MALQKVAHTDTKAVLFHYRRNFLAFLTDYSLRHMGMAFISPDTVLPALLSHLTDSPLIIGLNGALHTTGWLLPQLIAANYLNDKPQKKRYVLIPTAIGRPICFVLALALILGATRYPSLLVTAVLFGSALLWFTQGLSAVAWFDVVDKAMPGRRRGRLFGTGQVAAGLLTVGAGLVINHNLSDAGPQFPHNYAVLFLIGGVLFVLSWFAMATVKEPNEVLKPCDIASQTSFLQQLTHIWKRDRDYRLFIAVRLLAGLSRLATPFYVIFGIERLGLDLGVIGSFTSAQVIGRMVGAMTLGALYERAGGRRTIQAGVGAGTLAPLLALSLPLWMPEGHPWTALGFSLVFVVLGVQRSNFMQGFCNYLLDLAPSEERATYMALSNTVNGIVLWPTALIGGVILKVTGNSYPTLFAVTAAGMGIALLCTAWLSERR